MVNDLAVTIDFDFTLNRYCLSGINRRKHLHTPLQPKPPSILD